MTGHPPAVIADPSDHPTPVIGILFALNQTPLFESPDPLVM